MTQAESFAHILLAAAISTAMIGIGLIGLPQRRRATEVEGNKPIAAPLRSTRVRPMWIVAGYWARR